MNVSVHFSIGVIIASLTGLLEPLNFWTFGIIVCGSFAVDFDIFLGRFFKEENHRLYFTHSIYIPSALLIIGLVSNTIWITMAAVGYFLHIIIDMIDWGVNLFYFNHRIYGPQLLLKKSKEKNVKDLRKLGKSMSYYINNLYYSHPIILLFEIGSPVLMFIFIFLYAPQFWYYILAYFGALGFHLLDYYESKRSHEGKPVKNFLIRGQ